MSGVWIFDKNGVTRLISNPTRESFEQKEPPQPGTATAPGARPRVLVYLPTNQVIRSYAELELRLAELGWTRYYNLVQPELLQFHKSESSAHLISVPKDFANFKSLHMYDIVVKNRMNDFKRRRADHLRQGTLQQMSYLTTPQAARGLLALGEYFQRLNGYVFLRLIRSQHPKDGYTAGVAEYITSNNLRLLSLPHVADLYGLQILADGI
ncbi:hypothetical protein ACFE04_013705 [Oxalis oulophora]